METKNENISSLPFGKEFRVGNFKVVKIKRTLTKRQMKALHEEAGFPEEMLKTKKAIGLPVIKVSAISGIWGIEFAPPSTMFLFLDTRDMYEEGDKYGLLNLFTSWYADTAIIGDEEYIQGKAELIKAFVSRQKRENSEEEDAKDAKAIEEMQITEEAHTKMTEAVEELKKEVENGEKRQIT